MSGEPNYLERFEQEIKAKPINHRKARNLLRPLTYLVLGISETRREEQIADPWLNSFAFFARYLDGRLTDNPGDADISYLMGSVHTLHEILSLGFNRSISEESIKLVRENSTFMEVLQQLLRLGDYGHIGADVLAGRLCMSDRPLNMRLILNSMEARNLIRSASVGGKKKGKVLRIISFGPKGKATLAAALAPNPEAEPTSIPKIEEDSSLEATAS